MWRRALFSYEMSTCQHCAHTSPSEVELGVYMMSVKREFIFSEALRVFVKGRTLFYVLDATALWDKNTKFDNFLPFPPCIFSWTR